MGLAELKRVADIEGKSIYDMQDTLFEYSAQSRQDNPGAYMDFLKRKVQNYLTDISVIESERTAEVDSGAMSSAILRIRENIKSLWQEIEDIAKQIAGAGVAEKVPQQTQTATDRAAKLSKEIEFSIKKIKKPKTEIEPIKSGEDYIDRKEASAMSDEFVTAYERNTVTYEQAIKSNLQDAIRAIDNISSGWVKPEETQNELKKIRDLIMNAQKIYNTELQQKAAEKIVEATSFEDDIVEMAKTLKEQGWREDEALAHMRGKWNNPAVDIIVKDMWEANKLSGKEERLFTPDDGDTRKLQIEQQHDNEIKNKYPEQIKELIPKT